MLAFVLYGLVSQFKAWHGLRESLYKLPTSINVKFYMIGEIELFSGRRVHSISDNGDKIYVFKSKSFVQSRMSPYFLTYLEWCDWKIVFDKWVDFCWVLFYMTKYRKTINHLKHLRSVFWGPIIVNIYTSKRKHFVYHNNNELNYKWFSQMIFSMTHGRLTFGDTRCPHIQWGIW